MVPAAPIYRHVTRTAEATREEISIATAPRAVPLVEVERIEDFVASPFGRYLTRPGFVIWCRSPELQGAILWGAIGHGTLRELMAAGAYVHRADLSKRRRVLVDCSGVERVDADVLLGFASLARDRVAVWSSDIERQAIVVPSGLGGILLAGAVSSLGVSHPLRFVHALDDALAHVDHAGARAAHDQAAEVASAVRGRSALVVRLRAELGRALATATVDGAAAALGMSVRTLQRELGRLGTSFSDELRCVRINAAEALLVHSDLKIEAIANQVGFGTASRMSATLRRELNVTASALRARARS